MNELFPGALPESEKNQLEVSDVPLRDDLPPGTIITVRGTSGSGKSYLVRSVMALYDDRVPVYAEKRKRPLYYILTKNAPWKRELVVLGSYESDCGGCDTITGTAYIHDLVKRHALSGRDVLFEGLMLSGDVIHTKAMGLTNHLLFLNTPLEECLESVARRRAEKGQPEKAPKGTAAKHKFTARAYERAVAEIPNAKSYWLSREEAFLKAKELLKLC